MDENSGLVCYIEFLGLLQSKKISFDYFNRYSYDELCKMKQVYEIGSYLEDKFSNKENVGS